MDAGTAWIALLCYTFSLYMDFSGYSDMAIGMAAMFGFDFKENFNFPYLSTSVTEFWRRWHISLGDWFRSISIFLWRKPERKCIPESVYCIPGNGNLAWGSLGLSFLGSHAWSLCGCGAVSYEEGMVRKNTGDPSLGSNLFHCKYRMDHL